jgi:hypothetical protein
VIWRSSTPFCPVVVVVPIAAPLVTVAVMLSREISCNTPQGGTIEEDFLGVA